MTYSFSRPKRGTARTEQGFITLETVSNCGDPFSPTQDHDSPTNQQLSARLMFTGFSCLRRSIFLTSPPCDTIFETHFFFSTLQIPLPSPRLAKIAADVLDVDKDLKPEVSRRLISTQDNILTL